nr:PREDICTED: uncharacterized protein LOC109043097 isoform X1 [Bemisia tabaci]
MLLLKPTIVSRLVWSGMVLASILGALLMIKGTFARYNSNPSVISRETDFRSWNTPMPASTFCLMNQSDPEKVSSYIERHWGINSSNNKYNYYRNFVEDVANFHMEDLSKFSKYSDDPSLLGVNMLLLALQVIAPINATTTVFNPEYNSIKYHPIVSEVGICYSFSSPFSEIFSVRKENSNSNGKVPLCNFLNSHCFTRIENLPQTSSIKFFVHSPLEVATLESSANIVEPCEENDSTFKFFQIIASKELRALRPDQRKCKFHDEPGPMSELPSYSYNICRMECRKKLSLSLCGCAPFIYHSNSMSASYLFI